MDRPGRAVCAGDVRRTRAMVPGHGMDIGQLHAIALAVRGRAKNEGTGMKKIVVLIDQDSNECMYIDGKRWSDREETTVYCTDLARVTSGSSSTVTFEHRAVERPTFVDPDRDDKEFFESWPDTLVGTFNWDFPAVV